ncbi:retrovirus-related pol polyprotein from transposon TNT 1-94 [Tanacetum coccineum]
MTHHPSPIQSYRGNFYTLVIVDDYSRYTWTFFLKTKNESFDKFKALGKGLQNLLGHLIVSIQTDHGRELDNEIQFRVFCDKHGISHNFSEPHTPQSSGVVERKNQTFQEMSRTMLNEQFIPQRFWCHAVKTVAYILNRVLIGKTINKTPYEILRCRKPSLEYFRVFRCKCIISKSLQNTTSSDSISYNGIFLGYSQTSKAYIVLNKETLKIEESLNVTFDEILPKYRTSPLVDDDMIEEQAV